MVARRKADPDDSAANEASTSGAPENDAFKDLIIAVSFMFCYGFWLLWLHSNHTFAAQLKKARLLCTWLTCALSMKFTQCRQGVKLAGQKVQAGVGAGVEETMEDRTSSQSLAVELGNTVISSSEPLLVLHDNPLFGESASASLQFCLEPVQFYS